MSVLGGLPPKKKASGKGELTPVLLPASVGPHSGAPSRPCATPPSPGRGAQANTLRVFLSWIRQPFDAGAGRWREKVNGQGSESAGGLAPGAVGGATRAMEPLNRVLPKLTPVRSTTKSGGTIRLKARAREVEATEGAREGAREGVMEETEMGETTDQTSWTMTGSGRSWAGP